MLLRPLSRYNGGYDELVHSLVQQELLYVPFKNFLLAYFLKKASCATGRAR